MIAVLFEVWPEGVHKQRYLDTAAGLRALLDGIDGFISIERFESLYEPDKILSLSIWRDEDAVTKWRQLEAHRAAQAMGRAGAFKNYRIRVANIVRDYGMLDRDGAPGDSREFHGKPAFAALKEESSTAEVLVNIRSRKAYIKKELPMSSDRRTWFTEIISDFVKNSPDNSLRMEPDEKAFDEVLVGFSGGSDALYEAYKDLVGELHWTPLEAFSLKFPGAAVNPDDLTVISWVLPHREPTKADNRRETFYPSRRWVQARFPGEEFNNSLRRHVVEELGRKGIKAVAPALLPEWSWEKSLKYVFVSTWSERHAAYAAGLGTFGLCDGLITPKGKAHRVGSVVANLTVPPTARLYDDHHAYCLFFSDGSCSGCRKRCPVGAITEEGHNKVKCWDHAGVTCAQFVKENYGFDGYGCGLCQTGVPCESGIPKKILKSMGQRRS